MLDIPRGYCFKFHKGGHCSGCSCKHSCSKCDRPHRAMNCNFRAFSKRSNTHLPNRRSNKVPGSQIIPQPTSVGAPNTRRQWSFAIFSFCVYPLHGKAVIHWLQIWFSFALWGAQDSSCPIKPTFCNPKPRGSRCQTWQRNSCSSHCRPVFLTPLSPISYISTWFGSQKDRGWILFDSPPFFS